LQFTFGPTAAAEDSKLPKLGVGIQSSDFDTVELFPLTFLLALEDIARRSHQSINLLHHSYHLHHAAAVAAPGDKPRHLRLR